MMSGREKEASMRGLDIKIMRTVAAIFGVRTWQLGICICPRHQFLSLNIVTSNSVSPYVTPSLRSYMIVFRRWTLYKGLYTRWLQEYEESMLKRYLTKRKKERIIQNMIKETTTLSAKRSYVTPMSSQPFTFRASKNQRRHLTTTWLQRLCFI